MKDIQLPLNLCDFLTIQSEDWPYSQIPKLRTEDQCSSSVGMITHLLCDHKKTKDNEFEDSKEYKTSPIVNELFKSTPPDEKEEIYSLFSIQHCGSHTYLIEKNWNKDKNEYLYRIHHSYLKKFTLGQWEGTDPWAFSLEFKDDPYIKYYTQFRGRQLTSIEIKKFIEQEIKFQQEAIKDPFNLWQLRSSPYEMGARMYVINNKKLQKLKALLEAQPKTDQEKNILTSQSSLFIPTYEPENNSSDSTVSSNFPLAKYNSLAHRQCGFFSKLNPGASILEVFKQMYITHSQVMPVYPPFLFDFTNASKNNENKNLITMQNGKK